MDLTKLEQDIKLKKQEVQDLDNELGRLSKEKIGQLNEIGKYRQEIISLAKEKRLASEKLVNIKDEIGGQLLEYRKKEAKAKEYIKNSEDIRMELQEKIDKLENDTKLLSNRDAINKDNLRKHNIKLVQFTKDQENFKIRQKFQAEEALRLNKQRDSLDDKHIKTEAVKQETFDTLQQAKGVLEKANIKLKNSEESEKEQIEAKRVLASTQDDANKLEETLKKNIEELAEAIESTKTAEQRFVKQLDALQTKDDELKIEALKLKKIVKEKDTKRQLKELEELTKDE